ncbi:hypothetical protein PoB_006923600 [Plakobranchus ocellatus]|uniref:Uncharacterized protein n=1 Tax=Plakobranchus ocellatus TaxID=259542 RepID=A0AAV4DEZ6_9GAST|nr:hypothetical protein PoB_006923600 [Plakobranchus ocellatus]
MCELLTGNQGSINSIPVPDLYSSHEEDDSRIILHCMYASQQPTTERVIVRSPDSDVFLLLKPSHTSADKVRYDKVRQCFKGKKGILSNSEGVDLSQMPPCQDVLMLRTQRANFQLKIWRVSSSNFPDLPKPENNRWRLSSSDGLEIKWFS